MMDFHKKGEDSINYFNEKYGAVEGDKRKKFINTMFGLLNQKEQAVLNPMLLEDGVKSKDNVYRTYRADRVSKAVPMAPEEYAAMPFSYEAVSQVRMPEAQRAMPEGEQTPTRFMPEGVDEDKFYSQLDRVITDKVPTRATAQQIMATIDPTRGSGVKADEIKWSGIEQALASLEKDGKVSKEDLLNYLRNEGRVRFEEVTLGEGRNAYEAERSRLGEQLGRGEITSQEYRRLTDELDSRTQEQPEAKFAQYVLPGGENYREVVLAMSDPKAPEYHKVVKLDDGTFEVTDPDSYGIPIDNRDDAERQAQYMNEKRFGGTPPSYTSSHFPDIPNYVAHMRTNERTLDDGSEGLFVEEFQSDRHQEGRKKGYRGEGTTLPQGWTVDEVPTYAYMGGPQTGTEWMVFDASKTQVGFGSKTREEAILSANSGDLQGSVADAPFRTTWPIQLFKRALRDAVDGGKDWIGWTTGETQNERFDLSKQVDSISVPMVNADGSRSVRIDPKDGTSFKMMVDSNGIVNGYQSADQFTGKRLDEVVGKDMADKIIALESPANFEGNDLKVGGSGMRGFYDNMLPKEVGKYVKQFGGKVEKSEIDVRVPEENAWYEEPKDEHFKPIWKVSITPEMRKISQTGQMRFMPEKLDSDYMKAVESGDVEAQQRMVDEAAKQAGWNVIPVSHGSGSQFNEFKREFLGTATGGKSANEAFFFTNSPKTSRNYATYAAEEGPIKELLRKADEAEKKGDWDAYEKFLTEAEDASYGELGAEAAAKRRENAKVYNVYLKGKFMELDAEGKTPEQLSTAKDLSEFDGSLTAAIKKAKKDGYDGVVFRNLDDAPNISDPSDHYAVIDPKAIKLSDPITRDDSGNVIPLSKRFDVGSRDMRYMPEGEKATPAEVIQELTTLSDIISNGGKKPDGSWLVNYFADPVSTEQHPNPSLAQTWNQIASSIDVMGLDYEVDRSRKSESKYVSVKVGEDAESAEWFKIRISAHYLPVKYDDADITVANSLAGSRGYDQGGRGQHWTSAIKVISEKSGKELPANAKTILTRFSREDSLLAAESRTRQIRENLQTAQSREANNATLELGREARPDLAAKADALKSELEQKKTGEWETGYVLSGSQRKDTKYKLAKINQQIFEAGKTLKPKRRSTAKGNASAIANAAKLK
jgi:hypothetical protein